MFQKAIQRHFLFTALNSLLSHAEMDVVKKYQPFWMYALWLCSMVGFFYPLLHLYVDPDGTAYLTIAQRYASGDVHTAINGYWSPWACWLAALGIKLGLQAILSGVIVNTLGAIGFLYAVRALFIQLQIIPHYCHMLLWSMAFFLCFAVYYQSFDDLWECFFLMVALLLMISEAYTTKWLLWVLTGMLGALAYFAKSYALPFFILNTVVCLYFITGKSWVKTLTIWSVIIITVVVYCFPWWWLLQHKYGFWTTSTAGSLNTSWYLVGHPYWKPQLQQLLPPAHADSPYYWEDPYYANAATPHFWSSGALALRQSLRLVQNTGKLLVSMVQLSVFFPFVAIVLGSFVVNRKVRNSSSPAFIVALSFCLFPLGYWLVNFEQRYIWYMLPIGLAGGMLFIQNHVLPNQTSKWVQIIPYLFVISFWVYPSWWLFSTAGEGRIEYRLAQEMKQQYIQGSWCSNALPGDETRFMVRLAYFTGNPYYAAPVDQSYPASDIIRYGVKYYVYFPDQRSLGSVLDPAAFHPPLYKIFYDSVSHISVFKICP